MHTEPICGQNSHLWGYQPGKTLLHFGAAILGHLPPLYIYLGKDREKERKRERERERERERLLFLGGGTFNWDDISLE
jgi:hypothetical protein